jgi:hypothetical protein
MMYGMRFPFTVMIMLCLAVLLVGCGAAGSEAEPAETASGEATGEKPSAGASIAITPPERWEPVAGSTLPVQYMKNGASFMIKSERFLSDTPDDAVEEAKEAFAGAFSNVVYEDETEALTVDGREARRIVFTCEVSGLAMKYETVYVFADGGVVYAITFGDMADTFASLAADYEQILADIRFE